MENENAIVKMTYTMFANCGGEVLMVLNELVK